MPLFKISYFVTAHQAYAPAATSYRYIEAPDLEDARRQVSLLVEECHDELAALGFHLLNVEFAARQPDFKAWLSSLVSTREEPNPILSVWDHLRNDA